MRTSADNRERNGRDTKGFLYSVLCVLPQVDMKATIYDVAKETGLSIATVSRVINETGKVREETRQKVLRAIQKLEYEPSMMAKGLAASSTHIINLSIRAKFLRTDQSQYIIRFINGVISAAAENDYQVLVSNASSDQKGKIKGADQSDGVIFAFVHNNEKEIETLIREGKPVVYAGIRQLFDRTGHEVYGGFHLYRRDAIDELYQRGYRRIAMLEAEETGHDKLLFQNLTDVVEASNKRYAEDGFSCRIFYTGLDRAKMREAIASYRPDAIFLCGVEHYMVLSDIVNDLGLRVPGDLAVIAASHSKHGGLEYDPTVSTMFLDSYEMGQRAAALLIREIEDTQTPFSVDRKVPYTFIDRQSVLKKKH